MHRLAGSSGIHAASRLERHLRDAHTVRRHGFVAGVRLEAAGPPYLGVEPEFPLLGMWRSHAVRRAARAARRAVTRGAPGPGWR